MLLSIRYSYQNEERSFLASRGEVVVGRSGKLPVDIDLSADQEVSRQHARFYYEDGKWWVKDLGSGNGVVLNGRLVQTSIIEPNDSILIGQTTLTVDFERLGSVTNAVAIDEVNPPQSLGEDQLLEILGRISSIVAYSTGGATLDHFLDVIRESVPSLSNATILLGDVNELVPQVMWPPDKSSASFTLAMRAAKSKQALIWEPVLDQSGQMFKLLKKPRQTAPFIGLDDQDAAETVLGKQAIKRVQEASSAVSPESSDYEASSHVRKYVKGQYSLYVPMMFSGRVTGLIHVDLLSSKEGVWKILAFLTAIASTIGLTVKASGEESVRRIPSVFISYAREDWKFVRQLVSDLRRHRVRVWFDERLRSGGAWLTQLTTAIETSDAFLLLMSPSSVASEYVRWELETARILKKRVVPIMYKPCEVPASILNLQYIQITDSYERAIEELSETLHSLPVS